MKNHTVASYTLAGPYGVDVAPVSVSCTLDPTKPGRFTVTGPGIVEHTTKEISVRVRSAMLASGFKMPSAGSAIEIACDVPVRGSMLDLPIALAIMSAQERPLDLDAFLVAGELGLDGKVRPVRGVFQASQWAHAHGLHVLVPGANARDAVDASDRPKVHTIALLRDVYEEIAAPTVPPSTKFSRARHACDFADVRGQGDALAAVERAAIAHYKAPGSRVLLLAGAPGTGKTMIARRIPTILPKTTRTEDEAITCVYSSIGLADGLITERPFRAPHHTISAAALVGKEVAPGKNGGQVGEVHLAAHGVLFLDELAEFSMSALEALGYALAKMPPAARPLLVAATNECPCGFGGSSQRVCTCPPSARASYSARIEKALALLARGTGATVERANVAPVSLGDLRDAPQCPTFASEAIRSRVIATLQTGPNGLLLKTCKRCENRDEFTSESDAHGICARCMARANRPEAL